jgi:hypothetical protein
MTSAYNFTSEEGLRRYLTEQSQCPKWIQPLKGGTANYVYLAEFKDRSSCVFKHAAPYLHSNNAFKFDSARMDFEAAILKAVPSIESSKSAAHAVEFLEYDSEYKLLNIGYGGSHNLKEAYGFPQFNIREVAYDLAKWLATLHLRRKQRDRCDYLSAFLQQLAHCIVGVWTRRPARRTNQHRVWEPPLHRQRMSLPRRLLAWQCTVATEGPWPSRQPRNASKYA